MARREFPDALQAASKIDVDDTCAQWATYDNLVEIMERRTCWKLVLSNQTFFDIVKGAMVCEEQQQFKNTPRQILNMDETTYNNDQNFFDTMKGAKVSAIWLKRHRENSSTWMRLPTTYFWRQEWLNQRVLGCHPFFYRDVEARLSETM